MGGGRMNKWLLPTRSTPLILGSCDCATLPGKRTDRHDQVKNPEHYPGLSGVGSMHHGGLVKREAGAWEGVRRADGRRVGST